MKKYSSSILLIILITLIYFLTAYVIEFFLLSTNYDTSKGYIKNLDEVKVVYNMQESTSQFEKDLTNIGYIRTGRGRYERAYNKTLCEVVSFDDHEIKFVITDVCVDVLSEEIVVDYDNDKLNLMYFVSSRGSKSYLRKYGEDFKGIISYDFNTGGYDILGLEDYNTLHRFNNAYYDFLTQLNARAF